MSNRKALTLALGSTLFFAACGDDDDGTNPQTQSFTISVTPATLSVAAGGTGTLDVAITRSGGFAGTVSVAVEGLPTGVTASALTIAANATTGAITLTAAGTAAVGTSTVTIRGTGTGVDARTATVQLTVTAAPSFSLTLNPAAISVVAGQSGSSQVNITRAGGFTGTVNLTSTGAPAGMTVAFTPAAATGGSAAIAVNVGATVAAGAYPITIQGAGTGVANQTATLTVTVTAPASSSIALSLAPATVSVQQGQSGTSTLTIARTNFTGTVNLTASGAPTGMTVSFNPAAATGTTSTVTVDVGAAVPTGNHTVTIQGAGTGIANATATLTVTVTAPASSIALALNPAALSVAAGAQGTSNLTITRTNFTGDVTLTSSGAPAGVTVSFNPATVTGTGTTSAITVAVGAAVAPGAYPITIQGAGTGVSNATSTLTLTVTAAAGSIALSLNPATLSVQQGNSGSTALTIARTNFTGAVNLTSSGAPAGVTVTFNPASATGTTSTVNVAVGAAVATGTYQITLTGAGTGITNATATLSLTVTASGGGTGNVTLTFCQQSGIPLWVGYSNNGGAWTQAIGTNNVYSFTINTRGIIAYVLPVGTTTQLNVIYGTQAELTARGASLCVASGSTKTINATLNGVSSGEIGTVAMGGGGGSVVGGVGSNTVQLTNVQDGPRDLIGVRSTFPALVPNSIVIQRDLNIANNGSVTVDFATGVAPVSRTATIANLGTQQVAFLANFLSKNFTAANLSFSQPSTSTTVNWFGVPDASTVSGDFHTQTALATNTGSTNPFPARAVVYFSRLATNQTLTLPAAIATPPTVTVAGTSPHVTINSNWAIQSPYDQFWTLSLTPTSGTAPSAILQGSAGYFGSGPVQLNIPVFGAGFNAAHGLQVGVPLTWVFTANGGTAFLAGPTEGATQVFASVGGSLTP